MKRTKYTKPWREVIDLASMLKGASQNLGATPQSIIELGTYRERQRLLPPLDTGPLTPEARRYVEETESGGQVFEWLCDLIRRDQLAELIGLDTNETEALALVAEWEGKPIKEYCRTALYGLMRTSFDEMETAARSSNPLPGAKSPGREERTRARHYLAQVNQLMPPKKRRAA